MAIPIYNCLIDENAHDESGIYAISFVNQPANEIDFVKLSKQAYRTQLQKDAQKQILTGVVLCPDQLIYRNDSRLGEYYIKFSADEIVKIARKMMHKGVALHNTTHEHQNKLDGNYMTELWIVEDPERDKSVALGFEPLPKGTLMCSYKIEDRQYWNSEVMTGNVKGFSLEGLFFQTPSSKNTSQTSTNSQTINRMNKKSRKTKTLFSRAARYFLNINDVEKADTTTSGTAYIIFILADGKEVYIDADGFATIEGEQLPAGEHSLSDGNILIVDEQGQFIETKPSETKNEAPEETVAPQTMSEQIESNDSTEALKAKIAELEARLSELATLAKDANAEIQNLRSHTPSAAPVSTSAHNHRTRITKRYEQIAMALSMSIKNNKR